MSSVLVLFFTDNSSLVNTAKVIPGISDHEAVYVDASLCPHETRCRVFQYKNADYNGIRSGLQELYSELSASPNCACQLSEWSVFRDTLLSLINKHVPSKNLENWKKWTNPGSILNPWQPYLGRPNSTLVWNKRGQHRHKILQRRLKQPHRNASDKTISPRWTTSSN